MDMGKTMKKIGLIGGGFQHAYSTTLWKKPKKFSWEKGSVLDTTFFVDEAIVPGLGIKCERKIAWLVESRSVIHSTIEAVKEHYKEISKEYDFLFTHYKEIYDLADNFIYFPPHGYWIEEPKIHEKTKLVSMISSNKRIVSGHNYRLEWVDKLKDSVDLYGSGFNNFDKKESALNDYMFSITIENDSYETYWSEKILDCFATGTIPVYYGAPDIGDYFNMNGIILLTEEFDINSLTPSEYFKRIDAVEDNFRRVLQFNVIEDIIYEKYIIRKEEK